MPADRRQPPFPFTPTDLLAQARASESEKEYMVAIELYTELLLQTSSKSADQPTREARLTALGERGRLFTLLGEPQAALAGYEQYFGEAGSSKHAVDALVAIGNQCAYMNMTDRAIEAQRDALRLAESLSYTSGRAMAYGGIGLVYSMLERSEEALTYLHRSLSLFERLGDQVEQARGWNRIGVVHVHLGQIDKAIKAFRNSSSLAYEAGESTPVAMETAIISLNNLGECYQNLFAMEQALTSHQNGLVMTRKIGLPYLAADLARNIGLDLSHLGRIDEGLRYLQRALALSTATNQPDVEVQVLYSLSLVQFQRRELAAAEENANKLKSLAEDNNNQGALAEALYVLGLCRQHLGDIDSAQGFWQQALFLAHETGRRMLLWRLHAVLAQITSNPELASVHNRIAAEIIQQIARPIKDEALRNTFLSAEPVQDVLTSLTDGGWGATDERNLEK
jgi:tetratricopeptide (TPR) repeat protein